MRMIRADPVIPKLKNNDSSSNDSKMASKNLAKVSPAIPANDKGKNYAALADSNGKKSRKYQPEQYSQDENNGHDPPCSRENREPMQPRPAITEQTLQQQQQQQQPQRAQQPTSILQKNKPVPSSNPKNHLDPAQATSLLDAHFETLPPSHAIPILTEHEMHQLVTATKEYDKKRVVKFISDLQEQLMEHQMTLERMESLERRNGQLAQQLDEMKDSPNQQNKEMEEEIQRKKEEEQKQKTEEDKIMIATLEKEVVELKLNLAMEKSQGDHNRQSIRYLRVEVERLKKENEELWKKNIRNILEAGGIDTGSTSISTISTETVPRESKRHSMGHIGKMDSSSHNRNHVMEDSQPFLGGGQGSGPRRKTISLGETATASAKVNDKKEETPVRAKDTNVPEDDETFCTFSLPMKKGGNLSSFPDMNSYNSAKKQEAVDDDGATSSTTPASTSSIQSSEESNVEAVATSNDDLDFEGKSKRRPSERRPSSMIEKRSVRWSLDWNEEGTLAATNMNSSDYINSSTGEKDESDNKDNYKDGKCKIVKRANSAGERFEKYTFGVGGGGEGDLNRSTGLLARMRNWSSCRNVGQESDK